MKRTAKLLSCVIIFAVLLFSTACSELDDPSISNVTLKSIWKSHLEASSETEMYFLPSDYDGDGAEEAYGITGKMDANGYASNVKIYFIDSSGAMFCVKNSTYSGDALFGQLQNHEKLSSSPDKVFLTAGNQKFIVWEIDGGGSSSISVIFGVRNGASYQPKVSGHYQWFHCSSDGVYTGTLSDFSQGYHDYIDVTFRFNSSTGEFEKV